MHIINLFNQWYAFQIRGVLIASGTEDGHDVIISVGTGNSIFFKGQVTFLDIDGDAISVVGSDGDSNEAITGNRRTGHFDVECIGVGINCLNESLIQYHLILLLHLLTNNQ